MGLTPTDGNDESPRFDKGLARLVIGGQLLRPERKRDSLLLSRCEVNAIEPFEMSDRYRDAGLDVADIELYHLVASTAARILNIHRDAERFVGPDLVPA